MFAIIVVVGVPAACSVLTVVCTELLRLGRMLFSAWFGVSAQATGLMPTSNTAQSRTAQFTSMVLEAQLCCFDLREFITNE